MSERILNIVNVIIRNVIKTEDFRTMEDETVKSLIGMGYSLSEINDAFEFIGSITEENRSRSGRPVRILSPKEKIKLSTESQSELFWAVEKGHIDDREFEDILTSIVTDGKIRRIEGREMSAIIDELKRGKMEEEYQKMPYERKREVMLN